ncbi:MAG: patatin-like phospholipase RssA [Rhodocyclaceae bacterium]
MYDIAPLPARDGLPTVGLALGSGAARGWSHLGVIDALAELGIRPSVVCGCSIGALVGAAFVSGKAKALEEWVSALDWQGVLAMLDVSFKGGLIRGDRVVQYCAQHFFAERFSDLATPFACVATELSSGREVWLRDGRIADAVRASIALPGLFSPVERNGRVLVDGGLVNPVPVSLCRALGADVVIAVELGSGVVGRAARRDARKGGEAGWTQRLLGAIGLPNGQAEGDAIAARTPSLPDVVTSSINIMQMRIARSRLAGEPADVLISPRVAQIGMMEFDRAAEAIAEGRAAVQRVHGLRQSLGLEEHS